MSQLTPTTVKVENREYRVGRLDLFDALEVSRQIIPFAPILFGTVFNQIAHLLEISKDENSVSTEEYLSEIGQVLNAVEPFLYRLAMMDREKFEGMVKTCLTACERADATGKSFGKVCVNGQIMYADITIVDLIKLTFEVIKREIFPTLGAFSKLV